MCTRHLNQVGILDTYKKSILKLEIGCDFCLIIKTTFAKQQKSARSQTFLFCSVRTLCICDYYTYIYAKYTPYLASVQRSVCIRTHQRESHFGTIPCESNEDIILRLFYLFFQKNLEHSTTHIFELNAAEWRDGIEKKARKHTYV